MVPPQGEQEPCELQAIGDARRDEVARPPLAQVTHEQLVALARLLHQGDEPRVASLEVSLGELRRSQLAAPIAHLQRGLALGRRRRREREELQLAHLVRVRVRVRVRVIGLGLQGYRVTGVHGYRVRVRSCSLPTS